jgi:uncharacterized protein YndB with AHSA1/START domain
MAAPEIPYLQDTIEQEIHIAAPPERVFAALTDPAQLRQWWAQEGMYQSKHWSIDLRRGGRWRSDGTNQRDGSGYEVHGEYLQVEPPRLLEYTWIPSWAGSIKTVVRMELESTPGGTLLRLRHSGFTDPAQIKAHSGWPQVLGWLQAFVEKGETAATRAPVSSPLK